MRNSSRKGVVAARVAVAPVTSPAVPHGPAAAAPSGLVAANDESVPVVVEAGRAGERQATSPALHAALDPSPGSAEPAARVDPGTAGSEAPVLVEWPANRETAQLSLERRIRAHLARADLSVTLTDNRYTMISVRREGKNSKRFEVRLHHMFVSASPVITRALARYIASNDRDASRVLGEFIDAHQHRVRSPGREQNLPRLITAGRIHDLRDIFASLNARYFGGRIDARITWGQQMGKVRRRNSIKMGSYSVEDRLIRIHRSLDRPFVPRFFVEWVVFHEMLHQVHDIKVKNGRRRFHSREFMRDEARFENYAEARAWERAHLDALLTC